MKRATVKYLKGLLPDYDVSPGPLGLHRTGQRAGLGDSGGDPYGKLIDLDNFSINV